MRGPSLHVVLSCTTCLRRHPAGRSYAEAAASAVSRAGHEVVDMYLRAGPDPAEHCVSQVSAADLYIAILGPRYGTEVPSRPELSFTELEYETATRCGLPRRIFL